MSKILIFPLMKKKDYQLDKENPPTDVELEDLTQYYMTEIAKNLQNHGFVMNDNMIKDLAVASDFLKSAMFRNVGKYH